MESEAVVKTIIGEFLESSRPSWAPCRHAVGVGCFLGWFESGQFSSVVTVSSKELKKTIWVSD